MKLKLSFKKKMLALLPVSAVVLLNAILRASATCTEYIFEMAWGPLYWIICQ